MKSRQLFLILLLMQFCISSYAITDSGICGKNGAAVTWELDDNSTLTIKGNGDIDEYYDGIFKVRDSHYAPWMTYQKLIKRIVIEEGVTSIGNLAFEGCSAATEVTIANTVTRIGDRAFRDCTKLANIVIPNSVTTIGEYAFRNNASLTTIIVPNSVTEIGTYTFSGCTNLQSISFSSSLERIPSEVCQGCSALTSVYISPSIKSVSPWAFGGCTSLPVEGGILYAGNCALQAVSETQTEYTIKDGTTIIADNAFKDNKVIKTIYMSNSVVNLLNSAFEGCSNLESVKMSNQLTRMGDNIFKDCYLLKSIELPNTVNEIGDYVFSDCWSMTHVDFPDGMTYIPKYLLENCRGITEFTIPSSVTRIEQDAFSGCSALEKINLPNSITAIGGFVFKWCSNLKTLTIPASIETIEYGAFQYCGFQSLHCKWVSPPTIDRYVFEGVKTNRCVLHVPLGCTDSYSFADGWSEFNNIVDDEETEAEGEKQCERPTITFRDGHLCFHSNTPNAKYFYKISGSDMKETPTECQGNEVALSCTYDITAYAQAEGYTTSPAARALLHLIDGTISIGDDVKEITEPKRGIIITTDNNFIYISGLDDNEYVAVYSEDGMVIDSKHAIDSDATMLAAPGVNIIKIGNSNIKIVVKR